MDSRRGGLNSAESVASAAVTSARGLPLGAQPQGRDSGCGGGGGGGGPGSGGLGAAHGGGAGSGRAHCEPCEAVEDPPEAGCSPTLSGSGGSTP
jgi:hypothetical protein